MPAALLDAASCGRCGRADVGRPTCATCGAAWVQPASGKVTDVEPGPLAGVARASVGRRYLAYAIDLLAVAVVVVLAFTGAAGVLDRRVAAWAFGGAAVLVLLGQLIALVVLGRSLGRLLCRLRTVDDLTGTPVRFGRLLGEIGQPRWTRRFVTADLRQGRDPLDPVLREPALVDADAATATTPGEWAAGTAGTTGATRAVQPTGPAPSVGIVLANGERYDIFGSLLLGRSPVDPTPGSGRALLAWPDLSRRLAKTHVLLEWSGTVLWVTDLNTTSGTTVVSAAGERRPLAPGVRSAATISSTVECGGRSLRVVPGAG